jgi:hypothetical protein
MCTGHTKHPGGLQVENRAFDLMNIGTVKDKLKLLTSYLGLFMAVPL